MFQPITRRLPAALLSLPLLFAAGCAVVPEPMDRKAIEDRVKSDHQRMYVDQAPVDRPITPSEALARALRYNLDYRLKMMEGTLARGLLDVTAADMLPRLVADAGYGHRSNDSGGVSIGIEDRIVSLRPSTSEERAHFYGRATLSWNALDFGLSYYRAKQAADEVNIAEERRRRILQNIVQDVRHAYWRALGAQQLVGEADELASRIQSALGTSREAERAGVLPPVQGLAYQRALLDAMSLVNARRQEMQFALRELAALMNLPPGTRFTLAADAAALRPGEPLDTAALEALALTQRPELREEDYKARIGIHETRKQIAALFPNFNLFAGPRWNSNDYLYNNQWTDVGVGLSLDLFKLASLPARNRANAARKATDETRRLALSMAVLTQVRVAVESYRLASTDEALADESSTVDARMASLNRANASQKLESELEALRTDARSLVSRFQLASARAARQAAYGRVLNSIGVDLMPAEVSGQTLPELARAIQTHLDGVEPTIFRPVAATPRSMRPVHVSVTGLPQEADASIVLGAVQQILDRNALEQAGGAEAIGLELGFDRLPARPGRATAQVQWSVTVREPGGVVALSQPYTSFAPATVSDRAYAALAEAATLAVLADLRRIAGGDEPPTKP